MARYGVRNTVWLAADEPGIDLKRRPLDGVPIAGR
jgi:hypothetical protein